MHKCHIATEIHEFTDNSWKQIAYLAGPPRAYVAVACIGEQQAVVVLHGWLHRDHARTSRKARNDSSLALVQTVHVTSLYIDGMRLRNHR